jgi:hypothetical protein
VASFFVRTYLASLASLLVPTSSLQLLFAASNRCKETGSLVVASTLRHGHGKHQQSMAVGSKELQIAWIRDKYGRRGVHVETLTGGADDGELGKRRDEPRPYVASTGHVGP